MQLPPHPLVLRRRIEFSDTDAAGLIHFTTYYKLMEAAEAELFRGLGLSLLALSGDACFGFPRVDSHCKFRHPLHFDELVDIQLDLELLDGHRLYYTFSFSNESGQCCATGSMTTAYVTREASGTLKALPLPDSTAAALAAWKNQSP